jgi:hypothetical protein
MMGTGGLSYGCKSKNPAVTCQFQQLPVDKFLKIAVASEEAGFDLLMPPIIFSSARNSSGSLVNASRDRHSNI